ncbi:MAG: response regulator [Gemmatimonadetes bacterium]|nr:response regulator [Gemmatimonadota bacterium]
MTRPQDKTVLVVDDEPNVRQYLAQILLDAGFNVIQAGDGVEALEIVREDPPDFISLDLVMPRKSGHKLLYELRKDRKLSQIPVLIVTAHARDELGQGDLQDIMDNMALSGPGVHLEKPVKPLSYVRAVQRALGIEETPEDEDRISLQEELQNALPDAEPHALRRALEALKKQGKL